MTLGFLASFTLGFVVAIALISVAAGLWGVVFFKRVLRPRKRAVRERRPLRFEDAPFINPANTYEGHDYHQI